MDSLRLSIVHRLSGYYTEKKSGLAKILFLKGFKGVEGSRMR
jgi:hypothetical protein